MTESKESVFRAGLLSKEDMHKIHEQALLILENTGILIDHPGALQMLQEAGARVDLDAKLAKFPPELVMNCLKTVPRSITLAGRDPNHDLLLEPKGKMYSRNTGGMAHIRDMETGQVRPAELTDVADFAKLIDALPNISFLAPLYAEDVPPATRELQVLKAMLNNTGKHVNIRALEKRTLPYLAEAGVIVAGGREELRKRPVISILEAPIAPLKFPDVFIETLYISGEYGIPAEICSMPNFGATGPITVAGALLLTVVEHLATFVIAELAHTGTPIIWAPRYPAMDMATGLTGATLSGSLACAAAAQMITEHYNMVCDLHGPANNAIISGGASVLEDTVAGFVTGLAGRPSVLCGAGALELGLVASFEELVISDEIFGIVRQILDGFEVTDETLGADAIARVGAKGDYLKDPQTLQFLRTGMYKPQLAFKPQVRDSWVAGGSKEMTERVKERARTLLREHQPTPLDDATAAMIDEVIAKAEQNSVS